MNCKFGNAWVGQCKEIAIDSTDFCEEHLGVLCCVCGKQATHACAETGGFVCGAPLCDNCEHKLDKERTSGIMCGSGHCKKGEQEYNSWIMQEFIKDHKEEVAEKVKVIKQAKTELMIEAIAVDLVFYQEQYRKLTKEKESKTVCYYFDGGTCCYSNDVGEVTEEYCDKCPNYKETK